MRRLFTWLMLAFVGVALVTTSMRSFLLSSLLRQSTETRINQDTLTDARTVATWAQERWDRPPADLRPGLAALAHVANARLWLVDRTGRVLVDSQSGQTWEGVTIAGPEFERALEGPESTVRADTLGPRAALTGIVPVIRDGAVSGAVFLFVPQGYGSEGGDLAGVLLWTGVISVAVSAMLALVISRNIARPVEKITRFARNLGAGHLGGTVAVRGVQEVQELADTLTKVSGDLRQTFDALTQERLRLAGILQSMQEGVVAVGADDRVALVNDAAMRLLSWPQHSPLLVPLAQAPLPEKLRQALRSAASGQTVEVHLRLQGDGDLLAVCVPVPVSDVPGGTGGAVAVLRDLEAIMRLQRVRENFVADVAHELKGPLANLTLLTEAFADGTIEWTEKDPYVHALQDEVDRLRRLTRDVLDLARIDAGVLAVSLGPTDIAMVVAKVVRQFSGRRTPPEIAFVADAQTDMVVIAAEGRMEQVLYNLVDNAVRHSRGGEIRLQAVRAGAWVRLSVADTGTGIPTEHLPYIFDRFYKTDPARTPSSAGTGLGLAVVKQLVELQGGRIEVISEVGRGSTFTVIMPAAPAE